MTHMSRLALIITSLSLTLGIALANQHQQPQQQQPPGQVGQFGQAGMTVDQALSELRQMHQRLGQIIAALEGEVQVGERIDRLERQARLRALRDAQTGLRGLQQDIEAGERPDETAREIGGIRRDLAFAFADVRGEARERFTEVEDRFRDLETQVREGAEEAPQTFEDVADRFGELLEREREQLEMLRHQRAFADVGTRLRGLRADIEAGRDAERVADDIDRIRQDFDRAFRGLEYDVDLDEAERQRFEGFGEELGTLQEEVRAGEAGAPRTYDMLVQRFEQDFRRFTQPGMNGAGAGQPGR